MDFQVVGIPVPLAPGVDLTAYRIVQEALTNTIRHARAARAEVTLCYEPGYVTVSVTDSGLAGPAAPATAAGNGPAVADGGRVLRSRPGRYSRTGGVLRRQPDRRPDPGGRLRRHRAAAGAMTTPAPGPIRVLVVDDQELVRSGFCVILDTAEDITVVGEAANGEAALAAAARLPARRGADGHPDAGDGRAGGDPAAHRGARRPPRWSC